MTREALSRKRLEQSFFRALNQVVEPAVRRGIGAPWLAPVGLIVLETRGFKSGLPRRTPLLAFRAGDYVIVSTGRGQRSFWVKNLRKRPNATLFMNGRERKVRAFVMAPDKRYRRPAAVPEWVGRLLDGLSTLTRSGWSLALLTLQD